MKAMWGRSSSIQQSAMRAYMRAQQTGQQLPSNTENQTIATEAQFVEATGALAQGLYQFGLVMGTSAMTSVSNLMEPAFLAQRSEGADSQGAQQYPSSAASQ